MPEKEIKMSYKLKPNYHFSNDTQTGVNNIPLGRFIVVEDFGNYHEVKWFKKISNNMYNNEGNVVGTLSSNSTVADAYNFKSIIDPADYKRDITDSYSITEIQAIQSLYRLLTDSYSITECDGIFRRNDESYTILETNAMLNEKQKKLVTPPLSSKGKVGDANGDIAIDMHSVYYCYADYTNGAQNIWSRLTGADTGTW